MADTASSAQPAARMLLEREAELSGLGGLVAAVAQGRGAAAAVLGPAGIGKTSLLAAARERGMTCLAARGGELERDYAHGVVRQLLERPLRDLAAGERAAVLDDAAAPAAPVLRLAHADGQPGADSPLRSSPPSTGRA